MNEPQLNDQGDQFYELPEPLLAKIFRISVELLILIVLAGACYFLIKIAYNYYSHGTFSFVSSQSQIVNTKIIQSSTPVANEIKRGERFTSSVSNKVASQSLARNKIKSKLRAIKNDDVIIVDNTPKPSTTASQVIPPSSASSLDRQQLASKLDLYAKLNNKKNNSFSVSLAKFEDKFNHQVAQFPDARNVTLLTNKYEIVNSKSIGYQWYIYPLNGVKNIFVILGYRTATRQIASIKLVFDQTHLTETEINAQMGLFQMLSLVSARSSQRAASTELYRHKIENLFKGINSMSPSVIPLGSAHASLQQWKADHVLVFSIDA